MYEDFLKYQAQTTPHPLALEVSHAKGGYVYDTKGNAYLDFVAGVSACSLGHSHPKIIKAVSDQMNKYAHVMVYGEYVQEPAVALSKLLAKHLPDSLNCTYLVNSGAEAVEGALKLARRVTRRKEIVYAVNAYHGNTMGALSVMGYDERKNPFGPLLQDCYSIAFNSMEGLQAITSKTAAVILETIQGGAGFITPSKAYLKEIKERCQETGCLLILDEIQSGFGRTGKLFGFQHYEVVPDILVMGKGMGGGLPIGAFSASKAFMSLLSNNPKLGHITTFGGNPVIASAALATLKEITESNLIKQTLVKENIFRKYLVHSFIKEIRGKGLMLALLVDTPEIASSVILECKKQGLILFWLLFEPCAIRITPPLTISEKEIKEGCSILLKILNQIALKQ